MMAVARGMHRRRAEVEMPGAKNNEKRDTRKVESDGSIKAVPLKSDGKADPLPVAAVWALFL